MEQEETLGNVVKSWKEFRETNSRKKIKRVFVQWPGEWKLCNILSINDNKGLIVVETPSGGVIEVNNYKSLRYAKKPLWGFFS